MRRYSFCSITISKYHVCDILIIDLFNRDRIFTALSKIDSTNDTNHTYIQFIKNLSLPLNRLEKYANLLKEYLHNLEVRILPLMGSCSISYSKEFHIDRGDAQRAAEYYAELAVEISSGLVDRFSCLFSVPARNGVNEKNGNLISFIVQYMDLVLRYW